jgi:hypothetical protein
MYAMCSYNSGFNVIPLALLGIFLSAYILRAVVVLTLHLNCNI